MVAVHSGQGSGKRKSRRRKETVADPQRTTEEWIAEPNISLRTPSQGGLYPGSRSIWRSQSMKIYAQFCTLGLVIYIYNIYMYS